MTLRRAAAIGAAAVLTLAVAAGCGPGGLTATPPPASASLNVGPTGSGGIESPGVESPGVGSPGGQSPAVESPVVGVVIAVDSTGLSQVSGFTLRLADGTQRAFRIGVLENGAAFPPGHLREHAVSAGPVRVFFRADGPDLVVYRIEDAG